ncbi:LAFE_0E03444g1_1 [Lachancea fermentati]|uniref:LAFE_0E03444g1_1 n=1 Tax=Lachancea fermentati TaxID=4955 RepID=A0A1G4MCJ0_LACFM|nr:LAFE_0E03444g1_1 [Lachancea fermentati]
MSNPLNQFFQELHNGNDTVLSIDIAANGQLIANLQNHLQNTQDDMMSSLVEKAKLHNGSWTRYNILVVSFLKFCRDVDPWSLWESFDLVFDYYQSLSNCLLNDSYPLESLVPLFKLTTDIVIPLAARLDENHEALGTRKHQFLAHVSSIISKVFNSVKPKFEEISSRFEDLPEKQKVLLYVSNRLNNIYMRIDSSSSCANIFKNVKPKSTIQRFSQFPIREQIEYRYLLGRYYLLNHRVSNAFHQLNRCFEMLASQQTVTPALRRNMHRVLNYLIPAGILFGKVPSMQMVAQVSPELARSYTPLIHIVCEGNLAAFHCWLAEHETSLRARRLLLLLLEKMPMLLYRNLVRRVVLLVAFPQNLNKISYQAVENAIRISLGPPDRLARLPIIYRTIHAPENVGNVLETLVTLTFLKANCFPLSGQCVFRKTANIRDIFPNINEKLVILFPLNNEDSWLDE